MKKGSADSKSRWFTKFPKKAMAILAITLLVTFALAEVVGWSGQTQFYGKWVECGQKPLRAKGSGPMNAGAIHYVEMPPFNVWIPAGKYFCTPLEAEQAGYSASPDTYTFPHIEESSR